MKENPNQHDTYVHISFQILQWDASSQMLFYLQQENIRDKNHTGPTEETIKG
jgi:hypothetical protein